jgi:hypothetical protein
MGKPISENKKGHRMAALSVLTQKKPALSKRAMEVPAL